MRDVRALAYPPGTGKTYAVAREATLAAERGARVAIYVPTVALAIELAKQIGPLARVIRGRGQPDSDLAGQRMCQRADEAQAVGEAGYSAGRTLCPNCPFKADCAYLAQFDDPPNILIFAHAYLTIPRRAGWTPDFVVIDEAFWQVCIEVRKLALVDFIKAYPPGFEPSLSAAMVSGFQHGDVLGRLRALPDAASLMEAASRLAFRDTTSPRFSGTDTVADIQRKRGGQRNAVLFARILRALAAEMVSAPGRAVSHTVRLLGDTLHNSFLKELRALDGLANVLVIDAQADKGILERVMPGRTIQYERKDALRNADVVQVTCSVNGVARLKDNPGFVVKVARFASGLCEKALFIVPKVIRHKLTGETKDKGTLPVSFPMGTVDVGHYRNTKGSNTFKDHFAAVLLGRTQPPASAIEEWSGLFMHDTAPLQFTGEYVRENRGYCHPGGRGASVWVHPDPRLQTLLEQCREWECVQALDRLRLYGEVRKSVHLFTDLPLPVQVSHFLTEREIIPEWRDLALQNSGLLLDSPTWLAKTFPARFPTASVARDWLKAGWWQGADSAIDRLNTLHPKPDPLAPLAVYHRPKRGRGNGFKRALYLGSPDGIQAALDRATGKPTEFVFNLPIQSKLTD